MPPFLSMRAMVRAHVEARRGIAGEAAMYLARARDYLRPVPPSVLAIGGLPGSGKSTVARALAPDFGPAPGAVILRSDEIRKALFAVAPETRLGAEAYTPAVSKKVFERLGADAARLVAAGHAVIADATFMNPAHRQAIAAAAGTAPFLGVWLEVGLDEMLARVAARQGDASDADAAVLRSAAAADPGAGEWRAVSAGAADDPVAAIRLIMPHNNTI
jgi:hypothetical protein